jgi:hypothetical protein
VKLCCGDEDEEDDEGDETKAQSGVKIEGQTEGKAQLSKSQRRGAPCQMLNP